MQVLLKKKKKVEVGSFNDIEPPSTVINRLLRKAELFNLHGVLIFKFTSADST